MGALVTLSEKTFEVLPGAVATCTVTVKNTGTVVDQFTIDILGDPAAWTAAEPGTLSLFPGAEGTTTVFFRPPRAPETPTGELPFGVRARSQEDPAGSAVEEGVLVVGAYQDAFAELVPRTSRGSRGATHELAVDNRGNSRLNADVTAGDQDQLLRFDVDPPGLVVEPGTAGFAKVRVKPRSRFWRGQPKTRAFKVAVQGEGGPPILLDGSLLQEALLPRWLIPALLGLLAALILLAVLWLTVLQPAIKSAATAALEDAGITPIPTQGGGWRWRVPGAGRHAHADRRPDTGARRDGNPDPDGHPGADDPSAAGRRRGPGRRAAGRRRELPELRLVCQGLLPDRPRLREPERPRRHDPASTQQLHAHHAPPRELPGSRLPLRDADRGPARPDARPGRHLHRRRRVRPVRLLLRLLEALTRMGGRPGRRIRPLAIVTAAGLVAALASTTLAGPLPPERRPADPPAALPAGSVETPGRNELISTPQPGGGATGASSSSSGVDIFAAPTISADGRYVVYLRQASTRLGTEIVVRDRTARTTIPLDESDGNGPISQPTISADGRWIAYTRPIDGPNPTRIVLIDRTTRKRAEIPNPPGRNFFPDQPALSRDGRFLAMRTQASEGTEVLVLDRSDNTWDTVSVDAAQNPTGTTSARAGQPAISWDGRWVAFTATPTMARFVDSPKPTNDYRQVFLRDRRARTTQMVSITPDGSQGLGPSLNPAISGDGRVVAFPSAATDLVAGDSNQQIDVFAWSGTTGNVELVSRSSGGAASNATSGYPAVNRDGSQVVFASAATTLVPGDTTAGPDITPGFAALNRLPIGGDIFVRDRDTGRTTRVSVGRDNASEANGFSTYPSISSSGRYVAFTSVATNLIASDANKATPDVFVRDRPPRIAAAPNPVDFGSAPLGSLGTTRPATIRSTGITPAKIGSISIGGAAATDFIVAQNACTGRTLAPGATCAVEVLFVGTTKGNRNASLVIRSDAGKALALRLVASVGVPRLKVSPATGSPGIVVVATGTGFPPNQPVSLAWSPGVTARPLAPVVSDASGAFTAQVLIMPKDRLGERKLRALVSVPGLKVDPVTAKFLVVASTGVPPTSGLIQVFAATPGEPIILRR